MKRILLVFLLLPVLFMAGCDAFDNTPVSYEDITVGTGDVGYLNATWAIHYTATVEGQTEPFDSSYKRGKPVTFVNDYSLSPNGLNEGIQGMKVGGKRKIFVPSRLAYGRSGVKDSTGAYIVPRYSNIIYEVEFVKQPALETQDMVTGTGDAAKNGDVLVVKYKGYIVDGQGWVADGTVFDQTTGVGTFQFTLGVSSVIYGWHYGLVGMKEGGKRRLTIPPHLGYGTSGAFDGNGKVVIPPRATIGFDIELVDIK